MSGTITNIGTSIVKIPELYENLSDANVAPHTAGSNVNTKITASEWDNIKKADNYTISVLSTEMTGLGEILIKQTNRAVEQSICMMGMEFSSEKKVVINGYLYDLTEANGTYTATNTGSQSTSTLDDLIGAITFADLKYDETNRCYTYSAESDVVGYFYFENGHLVKFVKVSGETKNVVFLYNVGTTAIEIPQYTVAK